MASLFDTLGTPTSAQSLAPQADTGAKLQAITDVGTTGKAAQTAAPKRSNLGEAGVVDDVKSSLQQLDQQQTQTLKGQQLQAHQIDMEDVIQNKQMDQGVLDMRTKALTQATSILGDFERGTKQLNADKEQANLEQVGFNLRQANDRYLFNLDIEGKRNRLDNQVAFDEALQASVWGSNYSIAEANAAAAIKLDADQNTFMESLAKMDLDTAAALAMGQRAAYQTAAIAGGMTEVASGLGKYYASMPAEDTNTNYQGSDVQAAGAGDGPSFVSTGMGTSAASSSGPTVEAANASSNLFSTPATGV